MPRAKMCRYTLLAAVLCCMGPAARVQAAGVEEAPVRWAHDVHSMAPAEAAHAHPVELRAVLTFYDPYIDPRRGVVFVCDQSGCVFVSVPRSAILPMTAGDLLEISGVTGPGDYASIVEGRQLKIAGHPGLPAHARAVTMDDLLSGNYDCDWIKVRGRVRAIHRDTNIVSLIVAAKGGSFGAVTVPEPGVDYDRLVDSVIELTANTAPAFNQRRQMVAVHLFFPTIAQVKVIENAPPDPFSDAPVSVLDMFRFSPDASFVHRVHVQGVVTLNWPGRMLCLQDHDSALCMQAEEVTHAAVGSRVDVVGFPAIRGFKPTLEYASFRESGPAGAPERPVAVTADRMFKDDFEGKLIETDAELVGLDLASSDPTLVLQSHGDLFSVILPREIPQAVAKKWKEGSLLRIRGICSTQVDTFSIGIGDGIVRPESVKVLLRSADDITVLRAPSWWTPQHTWEAFGGIGLVVAVCLGWIGILRRVVKNRTCELKESQERLRHLSEHDALTGLPNRILLQDRVSTAFKRARRFGGHVGLLMADLDGFKEINDQMGHCAGDEVLRVVALRLRTAVRTTDTVARVGGDEFVIVLADIHEVAEAEQVAEKLVASLAKPFSIDGTTVAVTVSMGVVAYPDDGEDQGVLMQLADQAMYRAKQAGKNRIEVYGGAAVV